MKRSQTQNGSSAKNGVKRMSTTCTCPWVMTKITSNLFTQSSSHLPPVLTLSQSCRGFSRQMQHILPLGSINLFSLYGTTANGNMSPVALGFVFGNENKAAWMSFFKFVANLHPTMNEPNVTIITNCSKGIIAALEMHLPQAFNFHCSYHHASNVIAKCRGGKTKYFAYWLYKLLVSCNSMSQLERMKGKYIGMLDANEINYLTKLSDEAQFPVARCAMGYDFFFITTRHHQVSNR